MTNEFLIDLYSRGLKYSDTLWSQNLGDSVVQVWAVNVEKDIISLIIEFYPDETRKIR